MRLASLLIGRSVLDLIAEMRANGSSWPEVRQAIADQTSGEVDVTWQAVQAWAREPRDKESDTAA